MRLAGNLNVDSFQKDATTNGGYRYTTNARLSSTLANERLTSVLLELADLAGKRVLDIGSGDGAYTVDLYERGHPTLLHGIDPAESAVALARARVGSRPIYFAVASAYALPYSENWFDWAILRGVLHHLDRPLDAINEALRVSRRILVIEPNGLNPILKILERTSRYHLEHDEKSYSHRRLNSWVRTSGGRILARRLVGLVPMFCPNMLARVLKRIEPFIERMPLIRAIGCGQYVFTAGRPAPSGGVREAA